MQTNYYSNGTKRFIDIFSTEDEFIESINSSFIKSIISEDNYRILYNLLLGRFGTSEINSLSGSDYWKSRLYNIIYEYAPNYFKEREIQDALRKIDLNSDDLFQGTKAIYNSALNPNGAPKTGELTELEYISNQNTTNYKYSKVEGLSRLYGLLSADRTTEFLNRFQKLFIQVLTPVEPLLYDYTGE